MKKHINNKRVFIAKKTENSTIDSGAFATIKATAEFLGVDTGTVFRYIQHPVFKKTTDKGIIEIETYIIQK